MKIVGITGLLFLVFLGVQAGQWIPSHACPSGNAARHPVLAPEKIIVDTTLTPYRRIVLFHPVSHPTPRARRNPLPPTVSWVFGERMNWREVTEENLRWIPGISRGTAQRLIRLRDITALRDFRQLLSFSHVGKKTVQRLQATCYIPHAD